MSSPVLVLDDLSLVAPLGLRFWDVAAMAPAGAGLAVSASPSIYPDLTFSAATGPSGAYSFSALPGARRFEDGRDDDAFWLANPANAGYAINIADPQARYLPFCFSLQIPFRGFYELPASPLSIALTPDPTWLPVFSTPSRVLPGPGAVIRAQLQDDATGGGAAWAMVTAQFPGLPPMSGVADERGVVSLSVAYPEPANSPFGSLPASGLIKLSDQVWPIGIAVHYSGALNSQSSPDLSELLQQGIATAWRDTAHSAPADIFTVSYGTELVLRSRDSVSGRELPLLLITGAGSPI
jgi:hypothetical protein